MATGPGAQLSSLSDPLALARLQVLLIPVHRPTASGSEAEVPELTQSVYTHWADLFRKHQSLRGDEIIHGTPASTPTHRRSGAATNVRGRFTPSGPGASISRAASANHVHLAFPNQPPAKHLYPLSLLRMSAFPLVVIGIAMDGGTGTAEGDESSDAGLTIRTSASGWSDAFSKALGSILPPNSAFPLIKRLILVPSPDSESNVVPSALRRKERGGSSADASFLCRAPAEGGDGWVTKLLGEVVGQVFAELGDLAAALESPEGMKALAGTLLPSLSSNLTDAPFTPTSAAAIDRPHSAAESSRPRSMVHSNSLPSVTSNGSAGQPGSRSVTPGGRPTSIQSPSAPPISSTTIAPTSAATSSNPFRRSTVLSSPFGRSASASGSGSTTNLVKEGIAKYTNAPLTGIGGGRLLKLLGDMYLLTGMYADAIKCYDEGAERSRSVGDVLWESQAREGKAVASIGEAWEGRDGSNICTSFPTSPMAVDILSHYLSAAACLNRAPLPFPPVIHTPMPQTPSGAVTFAPGSGLGAAAQTGSGEGLLAYLYSSLCLRISHFVLFIFAAGGWGSIALSAMVAGCLPRSFPPLREDRSKERNRRNELAHLAAQSELSRHVILGHAQAALGPFRRAMNRAEQLSVVVEVAWLARKLGMERKEAAATREAVKLLALVVAEGREEIRRLASRPAGKLPDQSAAKMGSTIASPTIQQTVVIRRKESSEGNGAVVELIESVCAALGIEILSFVEGEQAKPPILQKDHEVDQPRFGWPELQVEFMKEAIAIAEALPDHTTVVRFCLSALKSLHQNLNPQSQAQLSKLYPQTISTIRRRGVNLPEIPWWIPGRIVLSVEICGLPVNRMPYEHSRTDLASDEDGRKDPFLYNPRVKAPEDASRTVLIANEQVDVFVTLRNVFNFDLEIQDLSLLGTPFITTPLPLILPASSVQTIRLSGMAPAAGSLQIRGVSIRLMDGSSAEFILPVLDTAGGDRDSKRRSRLLAEVAKTKRQGLEARHPRPLSSGPEATAPAQPEEYKWVECRVVEEQPLLWIRKTSLTHGMVMLYDGETSTIRITLENSSSVPVDFVKLSFDDSVARDAQVVLSEGELSPEQAYEFDFDTINRPVFTWDNSAELVIPPGGKATLSVQCLGKVGCTDGHIRIDYGYLNRPVTEGATQAGDTFHTRQLTFPVLFTVYHTLECYGLDLVRLRPPSTAQSDNSRIGTPRAATFSPSSDELLARVLALGTHQNVLFCISVRNVYGVPFEVALSTKESVADQRESLSVHRLVPPGATERLVLPVPRQLLAPDILAQRIPSLSGRQYVVMKEKRTPAEKMKVRERFWFRERLLSMVEVSWREPGSLRSGTLSLRDQPLLPAHLEVLRLDELAVSLAVEPRENKATLAAMDFVDVRVTVANNLQRPLRPYVQLEVVSTGTNDLSWSAPAGTAPRRVSSLPATPVPIPKSVAFDGVLDAALPELAPGESASHVVGAVLLASGTLSLRAAAEEISATASVAASLLPSNVSFSPPLYLEVA